MLKWLGRLVFGGWVRLGMGIVFRISVALLVLGVGAADGQAPTAGVPIARAARVAESLEAGTVFARIAELEAEGRYVQAVGEYERLLSEHGEAVVRSSDGGYAGVRSLIRRRLATWPDQAKEVCRALLEPRAAAALAELGAEAGPSAVIREAERWWLTKSAADSALDCAEGRAGCGCAETAEWLLRRLGGAHPELAGVIRDTMQDARKRKASPPAPAEGTGPDSQPATEPAESILWSIEWPGRTPATSAFADETSGSLSSLPAGPLGRLAVLGDRLLVQGARRLICFGLYSGRVEWTVGGHTAPVGATGVRPFDPAIADELVFAVLPTAMATSTTQPATTDQAIAAIQPDGGVRWTTRAKDILDAQEGACFASSPLAYERGLFLAVVGRTAAIADLYLVRLEPATGKLVWRTHLASWTEPAGRGVGSERIVSRPSVSASRPENEGSDVTDATVRHGDRLGPMDRARLTGGAGEIALHSPAGIEAVVAALTGGVERIAVGAGREVRTFAETPGDSIEAGGVIVQASEDGSRTVLTAKVRGPKVAAVLERRLIEDPKDCDRWLDLARWALREPAQVGRGVSAMEEALACAASAEAPAGSKPTHGNSRRIRRRTLDMAMEYGTEPALTKPMQAIAAEAATDVRDQVRYRLRFAEIHERQGRWLEAVELVQGILDGDAWREQRIDARRGGTIAAARIGAAIEGQGRSVYSAIEARAAAVVSEAISRGDSGVLEAAVRRYPNSRAAAQARLALAKAARGANSQRRAIRWLCEGAACMVDADRAAVRAQVAECYFELGAVTRGLASLARGAKEFADAKIAFAGKQTTFGEACAAWRSYARTIPRPLPELGEAVEPGFSLAMEKPFVLSPRPDPDSGLAMRRFDLVLVESDGTIQAIDATSGKIRWRVEWDGERMAAWLVDDDDVLVLASPNHVLAVDRATGKQRWRWALPSRDADRARAALVDPEFLDTITAATAGDITMVVAGRSGQVTALRLNDGCALWQKKMGAGAVCAIEVSDAEVACVVRAEGRQELVALDATDGRELARSPVTPSGRPHALATGADGSLIVAGSREVAGYDPRTLEVLWRWEGPADAAMAGLAVRGADMFAYGVGFVASMTPEGRDRWVTDVGAGRPIRLVRAAGGQVYAAGDDGLVVLDAETGAIVRRIELSHGEVIEDWTLSPQYAVAGVSRPVDGAAAGPRALDLIFLRRSAGGNEGSLAEKRVLLSASVLVDKLVLSDGAVIVQSDKGLTSWRCPTAAGAGASLPSN